MRCLRCPASRIQVAISTLLRPTVQLGWARLLTESLSAFKHYTRSAEVFMINGVIGLIIGGWPAEPVIANTDFQVFMFFLLRIHWIYCFLSVWCSPSVAINCHSFSFLCLPSSSSSALSFSASSSKRIEKVISWDSPCYNSALLQNWLFLPFSFFKLEGHEFEVLP